MQWLMFIWINRKACVHIGLLLLIIIDSHLLPNTNEPMQRNIRREENETERNPIEMKIQMK